MPEVDCPNSACARQYPNVEARQGTWRSQLLQESRWRAHHLVLHSYLHTLGVLCSFAGGRSNSSLNSSHNSGMTRSIAAWHSRPPLETSLKFTKGCKPNDDCLRICCSSQSKAFSLTHLTCLICTRIAHLKPELRSSRGTLYVSSCMLWHLRCLLPCLLHCLSAHPSANLS